MATKKKPVRAAAKKPAARQLATKQAAHQIAAKGKTAPAAGAKRAPNGDGHLRHVAPGLTVNDLETSMRWYRDVLGFKVGERWENEGKLMGVEMSAGAVSVNLGQDDWKLGRDRVKGQGVRLYITTGPLIDHLAQGIKARGGTLTQEPRDEWGMRAFSIADPDGYKMTFMFPLKK